jgi:hypothetical protein
LVLVLFIAGQGISLAHSFSHYEFSTKEQPLKKHHSESCALCFSANFQNQIFANTALTFCLAIFYLTFFTRFFDRVKLSYILSSKSSRAPPFNS